jgi:hypothetical protein
MVDLNLKDFSTIIKWWELAFAKIPVEKISLDDRRTFWKITFLCEDLIEEEKLFKKDE